MQNPLFSRDNSRMRFGDARERVEDILVALPKPERRRADAAPHACATPGDPRPATVNR